MLKDIFHKIILMILKQNPGIIRGCKTALKAAGITPAAFNETTIMDTIAIYDVNSATEQQLWRTIIQKVVVHPELLLEFHLLDGSVIPFQMIKTAPRAGRLTQGAKRAAIEAYRQGKHASEIAHEFDMSVRTIQNLIREAQTLRIQPINSK